MESCHIIAKDAKHLEALLRSKADEKYNEKDIQSNRMIKKGESKYVWKNYEDEAQFQFASFEILHPEEISSEGNELNQQERLVLTDRINNGRYVVRVTPQKGDASAASQKINPVTGTLETPIGAQQGVFDLKPKDLAEPFEGIFLLNQFEAAVSMYTKNGLGTNQAPIQIGTPLDILADSPKGPKLRLIDTKVVERDKEKYLDFALFWNSLPMKDLGGYLRLAENMKRKLAGEIGVRSGRLYGATMGLHVPWAEIKGAFNPELREAEEPGTKSLQITARDIGEIWTRQLYYIFEGNEEGKLKHSHIFQIAKQGSYEDQYRIQFGFFSGTITYPSTRPLSPPPREGLPPQTDEEAIVKYAKDYLMSPDLAPNETYTYGNRLRAARVLPQGTTALDLDKIVTVDQMVETVQLYEREGFGTHRATADIGSGGDWLINHPPCLRVIDTKVVKRKGVEQLDGCVIFRSWDGYSGMPENLGGLWTVLEEIAGYVGLEPGKFHIASQGLHVYDQVAQYAQTVGGSSQKKIVEMLESMGKQGKK